jgi:hypothetical protein
MTDIKSRLKTHTAAHSIGDTVYAKLASHEPGESPEWRGAPGMVTGIIARPTGVMYLVVWADTREEVQHYGIELESDNAEL